MEDLSKWTLSDLKEAKKTVDMDIIDKENFLGEDKEFFLKDGELWTVYKLKLTKVKDLKSEKTNNPLYNEKQLRNVKRVLNDVSKLKKRRNELFIKIKRMEWGNEYFENSELNKDKELKTKAIYYKSKTLKEFLIHLIKEEKHKYVLIDEIKFNEESFDDKKYIVYAN